MALDYSRLTDEELEAISKGDYSKLSDATLQQLATQDQAQPQPGSAYSLAAPAITGYGYAQPTGLGQVAQDVGQVAGQGLRAVASRGLATNVADVAGVISHGVPYGSIARGAFQAATANPAQTADVIARATEIARAAPGYMGQVGKGLLRGAARVAGPAGLAYDLYEAAPYIQQGGQELASGRAQERVRDARRMMLNAPTPAPLTRQEAENLIASGDQRMIEIYKNDAEVSNLIRRKAAERVMGPVAPGRF